jgi:hypothetical protein
MNPIARILILVGLVLVLAGIAWHLGSRYLHLGRLPGDLVFERGRFRLYLPLASSILLSLVLSAVLYLLRHFRR